MPDNCSKCKPYAPFNFDLQYFYNKQCNDCELKGCSCAIDAKCVFYNGPDLACSGILNKDTLDVIIQKIDEQICAISGDYGSYNFNCLTDWCGCVIDTEAEFVDKITQFVCEIDGKVDDIIDNIIPDNVQQLQDQIDDIVNPEVVCATANVLVNDTLKQVLNKYCTKLLFLHNAVDITGVDWDQCFIVNDPPTSIKEGFDLLIDQICQINGGNVVLPVFNNIGSCLANPGINDSLVDTINKIKTRLCQTPTFDINALNWGCTTKPSNVTTNLQAAFQTVLNTTNDYIQNKLTFSGDFVVSQTDINDPCAGKTVELAVPLNQDRFVASNALDNAPSTLVDKLDAGPGIDLDDVITPGKITISATGIDSFKVKANAIDNAPDFLDLKVQGQSDADNVLSITTLYNAGTKKVDFTPVIDDFAFSNFILDTIDADVDLKNKFCGLVGDCGLNGGPAWLLGGNAATNPNVNFIGTTDMKDLVFRVNNVISGRINIAGGNTSLGQGSMPNIVGLVGNTAIGVSTLVNITNGSDNTAVGGSSLGFLTSGSQNSALGDQSGQNITTGSLNTTIGEVSAGTLTTGNRNTAIGSFSMLTNVSGSENTAVGYSTANLVNNLTNATAIGARAAVGASNCLVLGGITGVNSGTNTNVGIRTTVPTQALHVVGTPRFVTGNEGVGKIWTSDANGVGDWAPAGGGGGGWLLPGNAGTVDGVNFIGTTDDVALTFRTNNVKSGRIDRNQGLVLLGYQAGNAGIGLDITGIGHQALLNNTGNNNTAIGAIAMALNTTGTNNTAVGYQALSNNVVGSENTAIGTEALFSTTNGSNTAVGYRALRANTTGTTNTAVGRQALASNIGGAGNTAIGYNALTAATSGDSNIAIGTSALAANIAGDGNVAIGTACMSNINDGFNVAIGFNTMFNSTSGSGNVAVGYNCMEDNISGTSNTVLGFTTLQNNISGHRNTAIGSISLATNTTGTDNTVIGYQADVAAGNLVNATAIGTKAYAGASNTLVLGSINGVNTATADTKVGIGTTTPIYPLQVEGLVSMYSIRVNDLIPNPTIGTATLVNGEVTVNTTAVQILAGMRVFLSYYAPNTTAYGILVAPVIDMVDGVSFKITSRNPNGTVNTADDSQVNWWIVY